MATKKVIGRIPVSKGEYVAGQTYNRLNQVTLYGSTYQSRVDGNTSAPAIMDADGNVQHANTDLWLIIADGREAYNAGEKLSSFSLQENDEFLAVETDAEGKILSATNADGSHYIHNAKSETIPEEFSHIDDPEGRLEITRDKEGKILSFRDKDGTLHEEKIAANHISLTDDAAKEVNDAFKSAGIKMENPSDFSNDLYVELPIPRIAAQVKIYAPKLPTTKTENIKGYIEYVDKDGNYFRKPIILNAQGSSSMGYFVKNLSIDIDDGSEIKFGDFPTQDSFHLKKYYIDIFRGQCIVGYHLMEQVYKARPVGEQYPYEYTIQNDSTMEGLGSPKKDFFTGAKCHPDGFPINITWVNSVTNEEQDMGIYTWNLKKSKEVYYCDKKKAENIILDGVINTSTLFGGSIDWSSFEIRNPKGLIDIDGNKYDGDNPKELSDTDPFSKKVKDYITRLAGVEAALKANPTKETFEKYFLPNCYIDYYLVSQMLWNMDGFNKNWIWVTHDGQHWTPTAYDMDSILGSYFTGAHIVPDSENILITFYCNKLQNLYGDEIKARYKELRDKGIFTAENIKSLLDDWLSHVGYDNIAKEVELYPETPSYRPSHINASWKMKYSGWNFGHTADAWSKDKTYSVGDTVAYGDLIFEATAENTNTPPLDSVYSKSPQYYGCYNSPKRVYEWTKKHLSFLDTQFSYTAA